MSSNHHARVSLWTSFHFLLGVLAVTFCDLSVTMAESFKFRSPITKLASDQFFTDIYVGGENFIASLSPHLKLQFYVSIGPVMEPKNCYPDPAPCPNIVQVLEIDKFHNKLLVCGTAYGGSCTFHSIPDICDWMCVDALTNNSRSNVVSVMGNHSLTTHFLSHKEVLPIPLNPSTNEHLWEDCRSMTFAEGCYFPMFDLPPESYKTAPSYEEHSDRGSKMPQIKSAVREHKKRTQRDNKVFNPFVGEYYPDTWDNFVPKMFNSRVLVAGQSKFEGADTPIYPLISVRYITHIMESFLMMYPDEAEGKKLPGIYVDTESANFFDVDFKYSFSYGNYSYIVSVQKGFCPFDHRHKNPRACTMLSRVNSSDPSLLPYIEIPIKCTHEMQDYTILTSATFGIVGLNQASADEKVPLLILAFGKAEEGATEPSAKYGTAICAHTLSYLDQEEFYYQQGGCEPSSYGTDYKPPKWSMEPNEPCRILRADTFGGEQNAMFFVPFKLVTSLYTHTLKKAFDPSSYMGKMYVYGLTNDESSFSMKQYLELEVIKDIQYTIIHNKVLEEVEYQLADKPLHLPLGTVDHSRATMYFTYGPKIFEINLDFCRQYTSCSMCQAAKGSKKCQWCEESSSCVDGAVDACHIPFEGFCPPSISGFEPRAVPVSGGSTLTIRGTHLGDKNSSVSVQICGQVCDNVLPNVNTLTCQVRPQLPGSDSDKCKIRVSVSESKNSKGTAYFMSELIYVSPNLTSFGPSFGPISGGTVLEVWGDHLMVGTKRQIEVNGVACKIMPLDWNDDEDKLTCRISNARALDENCGRVKVKIDNYETQSVNSEYCFTPDPVIDTVNPRNTIESGGIRLEITGKHFTASANIELSIIIAEDQQHQAHEGPIIFKASCIQENDDNRLECITPNIRNKTKPIFESRPTTDEIEASVILNERGTAVNNLPQEFFYIQRDPVIYHLDEDSPDSYIHDKLKDNLFSIAGKFIPDWLNADAIFMKIGRTRCEVVRMTLDRIFCNVTTVLKTYQEDLRVRVSTPFPFNKTDATTEFDNRKNSTGFTTTVSTRSAPMNLTTAAINTTTEAGHVNMTSHPPTSTNKTTGKGDEKKPVRWEKSMHRDHIHHNKRINEIRLIRPLSYPLTIQIGNWGYHAGLVTVGKALLKNDDTEPVRKARWIRIVIAIIGGSLLLAIICAIVGCVYLRRKNKRLKEQNMFYMGSLASSHAAGSQERTTQSLTQILHSVVDPNKREAAEKYIIHHDQLTLGKKIGSGNFGCVYIGIVTKDDCPPIKVAVKTLQDSHSQFLNLKAFVEEAIIMMDFDHENVLGLVGLAEKEEGVPYVILPYIENGDLLTYIRDPKRSLNLYDVIQFGADICCGMAYLSSLKFVHRDLAARNCMLDTNYRVKVADFGLCRDIYEKGYYTSDNKKKLPIRWMAIESIESGAYSTKSDVWSMGIVIWELLTRGMTPYPGVDGWDIINYLRRRRLAMPYFCPEKLYKLMITCWAKDPDRRPTFKTLQRELLLLIGMEMVSTPNTPEPKRNMKIFQIENDDELKASLVKPAEDSNDGYLVPKIRITKDNENTSGDSDTSRKKSVDDGYEKLSKNNKKSGSVMSLPRSSLVKNVRITVPVCYEFKEVTKEAVATYIQIIDNYEPPPRFANPLLRSKKKRNKTSRKSKDKHLSEETSMVDTPPANTNNYHTAPSGSTSRSGEQLASPPLSLIGRTESEGQLLDKNNRNTLDPKLRADSPYFVLEMKDRASAASILARSSAASSFHLDNTGSMLSVNCSSIASSKTSLGSFDKSQSLPGHPHSHRNSHLSNGGGQSSINQHHIDKNRVGSFAGSTKEEDVIEI